MSDQQTQAPSRAPSAAPSSEQSVRQPSLSQPSLGGSDAFAPPVRMASRKKDRMRLEVVAPRAGLPLLSAPSGWPSAELSISEVSATPPRAAAPTPEPAKGCLPRCMPKKAAARTQGPAAGGGSRAPLATLRAGNS